MRGEKKEKICTRSIIGVRAELCESRGLKGGWWRVDGRLGEKFEKSLFLSHFLHFVCLLVDVRLAIWGGNENCSTLGENDANDFYEMCAIRELRCIRKQSLSVFLSDPNRRDAKYEKKYRKTHDGCMCGL